MDFLQMESLAPEYVNWVFHILKVEFSSRNLNERDFKR